MVLYRRGGGGSCVKNAEARRTGPRARTRTRTGDAHGGRGTKDGRRRTGDEKERGESPGGWASCLSGRRYWTSRRDSVAL